MSSWFISAWFLIHVQVVMYSVPILLFQIYLYSLMYISQQSTLEPFSKIQYLQIVQSSIIIFSTKNYALRTIKLRTTELTN